MRQILEKSNSNSINLSFRYIFPIEQRELLLRKITKIHHNKVEIVQIPGLLADFVLQKNVTFQVRGVRSFADFDSEFAMGIANRALS